jgi:hypothetical protein
MVALTAEALRDVSGDVFDANMERLEYLAGQLAGNVAIADFSGRPDGHQRGYNKAFGNLRILADLVANGQFEVPPTLDRDQFEDWFFGRAVLTCGFGLETKGVLDV